MPRHSRPAQHHWGRPVRRVVMIAVVLAVLYGLAHLLIPAASRTKVGPPVSPSPAAIYGPAPARSLDWVRG